MDELPRHPLTIARMALHLSRIELARLIQIAAERQGLRSGTDRTRVRKWEVDGVVPDEVSQRYIAEALGLGPDVVDPDNWPHWLVTSAGVIPLGHDSTLIALREALNAMERRSLLTVISGSALVALAGNWAAGDAFARTERHSRSGKAVGDDLVTLLEETSARLNSLATEQRQHTAPLLNAHLTTVTDLIAHGGHSQAIGTRLQALAASLSQTVAWHQFDIGRHQAASRLWIAGLHSASECGDRDMGAALLGDLAYQASWLRDPTTAAGILQKALARTEHPVARSLLQLRLARALAAQGERRATLRALAAAEHLLGASSTVAVPAWCSWMSEADLAVDSGQCLLDLGDTRRAHKLIGEGQGLLPPSRDKTRGVFLTYRAKSHLDLGEPELAAAAALESLQLAQRIGAPRCVQLVQDLIPRFEAHPRAQGVPDLLERAAV